MCRDRWRNLQNTAWRRQVSERVAIPVPELEPVPALELSVPELSASELSAPALPGLELLQAPVYLLLKVLRGNSCRRYCRQLHFAGVLP